MWDMAKSFRSIAKKRKRNVNKKKYTQLNDVYAPPACHTSLAQWVRNVEALGIECCILQKMLLLQTAWVGVARVYPKYIHMACTTQEDTAKAPCFSSSHTNNAPHAVRAFSHSIDVIDGKVFSCFALLKHPLAVSSSPLPLHTTFCWCVRSWCTNIYCKITIMEHKRPSLEHMNAERPRASLACVRMIPQASERYSNARV